MKFRAVPAILFALCLAAGAGAAPESGVPHPPETSRSLTGQDMVLIHGLGSSAEAWRRITPYLEAGFEIHVYELPGHGRTPPVKNLSLEAASRDLAVYIENNRLVEPVLVGHGIGGMIALHYAFALDGDAHSVVVIDAAPVQLATPDQKRQVADGLLEDYDRFVAATFEPLSEDGEIAQLVLDQALRTDQASLTQLLMSSFDFDVRETLQYRDLPILVIGSAAFFPHDRHPMDYLDTVGYAQALTISFKPMPRTGHFVMLEQPVAVAAAVIGHSLGDSRSR